MNTKLPDQIFQFMQDKRAGHGTVAAAAPHEARWLEEAAQRFSLPVGDVAAIWDQKRKEHLAAVEKIVATQTAVSISFWR